MKTNKNRPISQLTRGDMDGIKMVCFDSDGVTAKKGTEFMKSDKGLMMAANPVKPEMIDKLKKLSDRYRINITSGRSLDFLMYRYQNLIREGVSFQSEIGNIGWWPAGNFKEEWDSYEIETVGEIKDKLERQAVKERGFKGFEPKEMIVTLHAAQEIPLVEQTVREADHDNRLYCWWNGEAYDIGPKRFNKGTGLKRMCHQLGMRMDEVMTVGNGVNDENMKDVVGIDVSTDPANLSADYAVKGEELGGERLIDMIIGWGGL